MYQLVLTIQYLSVFVLLFECVYIYIHWSTRGQSTLFLFCASTLVNNIAYLFMMNIQDMREGDMATKFCYVGKVWIPLTFLVLTFEVCGITLKKWVRHLMIALHVTVLGMVLTFENHTLYYTSERYFTNDGLFPHVVRGHTWFYNAYMFVLIGYIIAGMVVLAVRFFQTKNVDARKLYLNMWCAIISMALGLIFYLLKLFEGYDTTCAGYAAASIFLFFAVFRYGLMDTLTLVRDYVVDTINEGIFALDLNGKVIYCNAPLKKLYPDFETRKAEIIEEVKRAAEDENPIYIGKRIYEPRFQPLFRKKSVSGYLYVLTDITARYEYMRNLQEQKDIAEAANASKSAFLSIVTHEIRTPMSSVVGMTELMLRHGDNLNEQQVKYLKNIKNSGDSLVMIVNDILDQSKLEAGKMELVDEIYELKPLVDDVKLIIETRAAEKDIEILVDYDDTIPQVLCGDALRIRQVLINLMNNSVKFTDTGYVRLVVKKVSISQDKAALYFSVEDTGQGIKADDLDKLGQAFTQVDTKKNHHKEGTGLGLSISKDFIAMMGGQLNVSSEYGKGTEFYFTITQKLTNGEAIEAEDKDDAFVVPFEAPDARILIVDDTELNLMMEKELLSVFGMNIDTATSGEIALQMIAKNRYDAIFMDYLMPYMDGMETTRRIRGEGHRIANGDMKAYYETVPVIALSGDDSEETKELFYASGITDFTSKPIDLGMIAEILIKCIPENLIIKNS